MLLQGRYRKYERGLSQTPWLVNGVRLSPTSVAEVLEAQIKGPRFYQARRTLFHAAGREDVDVRMLGSGRPFCLELIDAKRVHFSDADVAEMQRVANEHSVDRVEVSRLRKTDKVRAGSVCCGASGADPQHVCVCRRVSSS